MQRNKGTLKTLHHMSSYSNDSRSSSPALEVLSPRDVLLKTPSPDPATATPATMAHAASTLNSNVSALPAAATNDSKFKMCGEYCDKAGCRTMRFKHNKRLVCTKCMPAESYTICSGQGCKNIIHADCMENKWIETWTCRTCTAIKATAPILSATGSSCCIEYVSAFCVHSFPMSC